MTPGSEQEFETTAHNRVSVDFDLDADDTGDTLATIILSREHAPFIQPGPWRLLLRGDTVRVGRYDVWIERTFRRGGGIEQSRFSAAPADDARTISIPGTARRIITVSSYVTRPEPGFSPPSGQISSFSSRGPTRYGLQKPEIAAPGEVIISARSSESDASPNPDQWHTDMSGTSMAAPHVTGAAALMLSVRPDLTCEQVKQILMRTARRDGFAFSAPDNVWGNGKLDVEAAVEGARTARFPQIRNVQVDGTSLSWQTDIPATGAVRFHTHQRQLQLGKSRGSRADLTLQTEHCIALDGLDPGTYYCEILAFSEDNWWTADDKGQRGGSMAYGYIPLDRFGIDSGAGRTCAVTKTLYDTDFDAWTQAQVAALRAKDWAALDIEHLAEEVEDLRKSERKAVRSHLRMVLSHLLKWTYHPQERDRHGSGWRASIDNGRVLIQDFLEDSPGVRPDLPELEAWAYPRARQDAAQQTGLPLTTFPEACPWPLERVLDPVFFPEA